MPHCGSCARDVDDHDVGVTILRWIAHMPGPSRPVTERRPAMLANNVVPILMTVFTLITLSGLVAWAMILVPPQLERRKLREIAMLTAGAELLADAIARHNGDANQLARLSANYTAHARALTQLGHPVPSVSDAPAPLARAA